MLSPQDCTVCLPVRKNLSVLYNPGQKDTLWAGEHQPWKPTVL